MSPTKGTPLVAFRLRPPELRAVLELDARKNAETLTDLINRVLAAHAERTTTMTLTAIRAAIPADVTAVESGPGTYLLTRPDGGEATLIDEGGSSFAIDADSLGDYWIAATEQLGQVADGPLAEVADTLAHWARARGLYA